MRMKLYLGMACLVAMSAATVGAILSSHNVGIAKPVNPEDVHFAEGVFVSDYFGLRYRIPKGWGEGLPGPNPSQSGYYVLGTWTTRGELAGTILVVAQDMLFASDASEDVESVVTRFRQVMSSVEGMIIDREPEPVKVGVYPGYRIDFSGVGLFRSMLAIEIRCHVVTFNLTSRDPKLLASLRSSMDDLVLLESKASPVSTCLRDHVAENILYRVEPNSVRGAPSIPVRIIVATDGSVKHVHVIRAAPTQRRDIEESVRQWRFKPYLKQGRPVEVETGVTFGTTAASM
jgi:TonB-like protein